MWPSLFDSWFDGWQPAAVRLGVETFEPDGSAAAQQMGWLQTIAELHCRLDQSRGLQQTTTTTTHLQVAAGAGAAFEEEEDGVPIDSIQLPFSSPRSAKRRMHAKHPEEATDSGDVTR